VSVWICRTGVYAPEDLLLVKLRVPEHPLPQHPRLAEGNHPRLGTCVSGEADSTTSARMIGGRSNKGMKLTSVERIGRSQLIPGVRRT
jgi:hypothetical protein